MFHQRILQPGVYARARACVRVTLPKRMPSNTNKLDKYLIHDVFLEMSEKPRKKQEKRMNRECGEVVWRCDSIAVPDEKISTPC